jgi:hypothetical protein
VKRLACILAFTALSSGGAEAAQARPDFSGTWAAIDSLITVRQDGRVMMVSEGPDVRVFNLDGSESRFAKDGTQYTARARWVGNALTVAITTEGRIGNWEDLQVFSLDHGPKLNVVYVGTQSTRLMMFTQTRTYAKR